MVRARECTNSERQLSYTDLFLLVKISGDHYVYTVESRNAFHLTHFYLTPPYSGHYFYEQIIHSEGHYLHRKPLQSGHFHIPDTWQQLCPPTVCSSFRIMMLSDFRNIRVQMRIESRDSEFFAYFDRGGRIEGPATSLCSSFVFGV